MHISFIDNYDWVRNKYNIQLLRSPHLTPCSNLQKDMQMNIAAQWFTLLLHIGRFPVLIMDWTLAILRVLWFSSVPPVKCKDSTLKEAMTTSSHALTINNHPATWHNITYVTVKVLLNTKLLWLRRRETMSPWNCGR